MPLPATSSSPRAPPPPRGLIRRLCHRLRRDTAAGAPEPGGETRKCSRWGRAACRPRALGLAGTWADHARGYRSCPAPRRPGVPAERDTLRATPRQLEERREGRARPGKPAWCQVSGPPHAGHPCHLPGRRTFPRLRPAGVLSPDHASRAFRSGVPSSAPPSLQASLGLERRLGVGGPQGLGLQLSAQIPQRVLRELQTSEPRA